VIVHDRAETPSAITLKSASTIAEMRNHPSAQSAEFDHAQIKLALFGTVWSRHSSALRQASATRHSGIQRGVPYSFTRVTVKYPG
jgi:hypothetical protein